jgi:hypothetical protein
MPDDTIRISVRIDHDHQRIAIWDGQRLTEPCWPIDADLACLDVYPGDVQMVPMATWRVKAGVR